MDQNSRSRNLFVDKVAEELNTFSNKLCNLIPELGGLTLIPLWRLESESLPAAMIFFIKELENSPDALIGMLEQTRRALEHQIIAVQSHVDKLSAQCQRLSILINGKEKVLEQKAAQISAIEEKANKAQNTAQNSNQGAATS